MATETTSILKVGTDEAVTSLQDLKNNVSTLKKELETLEIGTEEYQNTLNTLKLNQNAVKDAMYATSASMDEVAASASGASETYNGLVHRMAAMKEELRNTNLSTEEGRKRFSDLAQQIKDTNNQLKALDAQQGNYQRNVGDYANQIASISGLFSKAGGSAGVLAGGIGTATTALKAFSATPAIAILGALIGLFDKLKGSLTSSEENLNAVTIAFAPFKAAGDAVTRTMQFLAQGIAKVGEGLNWVLEKLGLMSDAMKQRQAEAVESVKLEQDRRKVNEENALSEQKVAELRAKMAEKDKYNNKERLQFAEQWKAELLAISKRNEDLAKRELALMEAEAEHSGNSAEFNDRLSQARIKVTQATTQYNEQVRRCNSEISTLLGNEAKLVTNNEPVKEHFEVYANWQKEMDEDTDARIAAQKALEEEMEDIYQNEYDAINAETEKYFAEQERMRQEDLQKQRAIADAKTDLMWTSVSATSDIISSLADIYESDTNASEKQLKAAKNLKIASATIDTIEGAIKAYMSCQDYPQPYGTILGAIQAATVTASGMANIAKIRSTQISTTSSGSSATAVMQTPSLTTQIPTTYLQTTQSQDETMAQGQRVTLVYSDIEAANSRKTNVTNETSF